MDAAKRRDRELLNICMARLTPETKLAMGIAAQQQADADELLTVRSIERICASVGARPAPVIAGMGWLPSPLDKNCWVHLADPDHSAGVGMIDPEDRETVAALYVFRYASGTRREPGYAYVLAQGCAS